jgi:hypothetical protein
MSTRIYFVIMNMWMGMAIGIWLNIIINVKLEILMIILYRDKTIILGILTHGIQTNNNPN